MTKSRLDLQAIRSRLGEENWASHAVELVIVILGVFLGMQVTNWNAERQERAETAQLLDRVGPALHNDDRAFAHMVRYYQLTADYGETALSGWQDEPPIDDRTFVVAAYQASQIVGITTVSQVGNLFSGHQIDMLPDGDLRSSLVGILSIDRGSLAEDLQTPYRIGVRRIIPFELQTMILAACGDDMIRPDCDVALPSASVRKTATALRAQPELVGDLRWHLAEVRRVGASIEARIEQDRAVAHLLAEQR